MVKFPLSRTRLAGLGLALAATLSMAGPTAATTFAAAAPNCQFILGFKTLHDMASSTVGSCVSDQAFNGNGDAQQVTTNGMMVWRKADNFTAFTDGFRSWVNGPFGVQERLNTQRFPWEAQDGSAPAPAAAPAPGGSLSGMA